MNNRSFIAYSYLGFGPNSGRAPTVQGRPKIQDVSEFNLRYGSSSARKAKFGSNNLNLAWIATPIH